MELTIQLGACGESRPVSLHVISRSDQGDRDENQDALNHAISGGWHVCALADGAGGHQGGQVAAQQAVDFFLELFLLQPPVCRVQLLAMVNQVNKHILEMQQLNAGLQDMHTTFCALVVNRDTLQALWLHVGDSRVYRFHQDNLVSRTRDHSMLQWMTDHQPDHTPPARNTLYTALGEQPSELTIDISDVYTVTPGDWFLLCSDGLWEHFNDAELGLIGSSLWNQEGFCTHIHQLALNRATGRADNLSSMVLFVGEGCHSNG